MWDTMDLNWCPTFQDLVYVADRQAGVRMAGVELGRHLVAGAPPSVYYVPDFITQVVS